MGSQQIKEVSKSFGRSTTAIDGWHPRHFGQLSEKCLTALAQLFQSFEEGPFWPKQQQSLMVSLLDKPSNDQEGWTKDKRPILLFRSLFRLWAKARQRLIRDWQKTHCGDSCLANLAGRQPGDAIWRSVMRATVAAEGTNCHGFEALWDISKAFDRVDHGKLIQQACLLKYPLRVLALSTASYKWARCLVDGQGISSQWILPCIGLGKGQPLLSMS